MSTHNTSHMSGGETSLRRETRDDSASDELPMPMPPAPYTDAARTGGLYIPNAPRQLKGGHRHASHQLALENHYIAYFDADGTYVNLRGDYYYLGSAYYMSQDYESSDRPIAPNCKEILDATVVPLMLEKAKRAGLAVPDFYITNGYFEPPVIVDSLNPFMTRQSIVLKPGAQSRVAKSMTRNNTYAICCQELPEGAKILYFRSILGWCIPAPFRPLAETIWRLYRVPLAQVRVVQLADGSMQLSNLQSLPFEKLNARELIHLHKSVTWQL